MNLTSWVLLDLPVPPGPKLIVFCTQSRGIRLRSFHFKAYSSFLRTVNIIL